MNFGQIEAVYYIVKAGTFGGAARELHLTQSALSHRIKAFEDELGGPLFVRGRRRATLTGLGQEVAIRTERIFSEFVDIKKLFSRKSKGHRVESLCVTATSIGIAYLYGEFFEKFIASYPEVDLQIVAAESGDDAIRRVRDRGADIALTSISTSGTGLESIALGDAEIVLIAGSKHPVCKLGHPSLDEVRRWPFVRHLPGSGARVASDEIFLSAGGYPRILTESSDTEYVKRIVSLGLGLSLVPLFTIQNELKAGTLHALRLKGHQVVQDYGIVLRQGFRPLLVDRFTNVCTETSRNHPRNYLLAPARKNQRPAKTTARKTRA